MRLDAKGIRYITVDEFRVLTAVETGSRNHEIVPTSLIKRLANLHGGGINKFIGDLARKNLITKVANSKYDGYKLTYGGYDYLALKSLSKKNCVVSVGNQIGVGKEADVYVVMGKTQSQNENSDENSGSKPGMIHGRRAKEEVIDNEDISEYALKIHRLGRTSFRSVKSNRDYTNNKNSSPSWLYLSRLSAQKEFAFMQVLSRFGFPVPRPIEQNRHCVVMELLDNAIPLKQINKIENPGRLYSDLMDLIVKLANYGLIHCDFNEFNLLIDNNTLKPILIDFPQMVSVTHKNAEFYFNRDVECIRTFFRKKFNYVSLVYPMFTKDVTSVDVGAKNGGDGESTSAGYRLDLIVANSSFTHKMEKELEQYLKEGQDESDEDEGSDEDEDEDDGSDSESESENQNQRESEN